MVVSHKTQQQRPSAAAAARRRIVSAVMQPEKTVLPRKNQVERDDMPRTQYKNRMTTPCTVCGKPGAKQCGSCGTVAYCSKKCQKVDWKKGHRGAPEVAVAASAAAVGQCTGAIAYRYQAAVGQCTGAIAYRCPAA